MVRWQITILPAGAAGMVGDAVGEGLAETDADAEGAADELVALATGVGCSRSVAIQSAYCGNPESFFWVKVMVLMSPLGVNQAEAPVVSVPEPISVSVLGFQVGVSVCPVAVLNDSMKNSFILSLRPAESFAVTVTFSASTSPSASPQVPAIGAESKVRVTLPVVWPEATAVSRYVAPRELPYWRPKGEEAIKVWLLATVWVLSIEVNDALGKVVPGKGTSPEPPLADQTP
jgi:hypothetical protein